MSRIEIKICIPSTGKSYFKTIELTGTPRQKAILKFSGQSSIYRSIRRKEMKDAKG